VCTNGDLIDTTKLHSLQKAGGDEIGFNLSTLSYDLGPVELACRMIQTVTVEIPAIPEDFEIMRKLLPDMQKIGVRHLNLHQLYASAHNYRELARRGYTIVPSVEHGPVVLESEMTALKLVREVSEASMDLSLITAHESTRQDTRAEVEGGARRSWPKPLLNGSPMRDISRNCRFVICRQISGRSRRLSEARAGRSSCGQWTTVDRSSFFTRTYYPISVVLIATSQCAISKSR
jgi:hypothetical protein